MIRASPSQACVPSPPVPSCRSHSKASCSHFPCSPSLDPPGCLLPRVPPPPHCVMCPFLLGTKRKKLSSQWQLSPDLLASPYLHHNKTFYTRDNISYLIALWWRLKYTHMENNLTRHLAYGKALTWYFLFSPPTSIFSLFLVPSFSPSPDWLHNLWDSVQNEIWGPLSKTNKEFHDGNHRALNQAWGRSQHRPCVTAQVTYSPLPHLPSSFRLLLKAF